MSNSYPTKLAEGFALQALEVFYQISISEGITNDDYEGGILAMKLTMKFYLQQELPAALVL